MVPPTIALVRKPVVLRVGTNALPQNTTRDMTFILEAARWAPSGDNTQPWTFQIIDPENIIVRLRFERNNPYEYNEGQPVLMAGGALVENMRIAASQLARGCLIQEEYLDKATDEHVVHVRFPHDENIQPSPLFPYIPERSVNRYAYKTTPLMPEVVQFLEASLGSEYGVQWYPSIWEKLAIVRMNMMGSRIRLSIPETYPIHAHMIDWRAKKSTWGIPPLATGLSRMTVMMMRWAMRNWNRMNFINRFMGGCIMAQLELDLIPGIFCARHFILYFKEPVVSGPTRRQILEAGAAMQRFWLSATRMGLVMQPEFPAIIFSNYAKKNHTFSCKASQVKLARRLLVLAEKIWGMPVEQIFFQGRIGVPISNGPRSSRSIRKPIEELMVD